MALISKLLQGITATTQASGIAPKIATGAMATTPTSSTNALNYNPNQTAGLNVIQPSSTMVQPVKTPTGVIAGATAGLDMSNYKADLTEAGVPKFVGANVSGQQFATTPTMQAKTAGALAGQTGIVGAQVAGQPYTKPTQPAQPVQQAQPVQPTQQPVSYGTQSATGIPEAIPTEAFTQPTGFTAISSTGGTKTDQVMAGLNTSIQNLQQTTAQAEQLANTMTMSGMSALQDEQSRLRQEISKLASEPGMASRKTELEKQYGLNEQLTQLSELNKQIAAKSAQYQQAIIENQGRNVLTSQIAGREGQLKRQMAVEIGGLAAMAEAMQGNIDMARSIINDTVELEFEDRKMQLDSLLQQLDWNREDMTKAEQKEAARLEADAKAQYAQMEIEQQNRRDVMNIAMKAIEQGADLQTVEQMISAKTPEEAIMRSGGTLSPQFLNYAMGGGEQYVDVKDLTAQEKTDYLYYSRMSNANDIISQYESLGAEKIGALTQYAPNMLKSSERQEMEQAQRDFVNAVLRRESGAAISGSEFQNAKMQYFPQPGDSPQTIANKRASRETALQALRNMAGRAITAYGGTAGGGMQQVFNDTQDDVDSINQLVSTMNDTGKRIFTNAVLQGVPYSFLNRYAGEIIDVASDPSVTEQQLQDFILEAYKQVSGFNQVGGDTKQASIQGKLSTAIPAGTKYTSPTDGECGYWSRKIVDYPSGTGDTLASKTKFVKEKGMPKNEWVKAGARVGDVIFTSDSPTYGHVAVINSINPDGTITLSESNYKGHYTVSHDRKISLNDPRIIGAVRGKLKTNISNIA